MEHIDFVSEPGQHKKDADMLADRLRNDDPFLKLGFELFIEKLAKSMRTMKTESIVSCFIGPMAMGMEFQRMLDNKNRS